MTAQAETHKFEAEVQQVLELVIHSLYAKREIFLRELLSNASDALDKLRFEALKDTALLPEGETLGIAIEVDREARLLRIADNGIGMSHDELVANLGTIASSGTRRFLQALKERDGSDAAPGMPEMPEMIGQFGVGFYSAFMVADEITVETRRAGEERGWRWSSAGEGYTIEEAPDLSRGTLVSLRLRAGDEDEDAGEFLQEWRIREVVKRYSDFVEYPIQMEVERTEPKLDDAGEPIAGETETARRTETLNSMKPLWARPKAQLEEKDYAEFYRHLTHDWNDPLETLHFKGEGALEFTALLYLPAERPLDLFDPAQQKSRVSLYVRRVLIMRECADLLPPWLRFVRGVVESPDLPLNVSRETIQNSPRVRQIQKRLVKKVVEALAGLLESDREKYAKLWTSFGAILKEGIYYGQDDEGRISKIALFESSKTAGWTTLDEYVGRMPLKQEAIYTIVGSDKRTVEASPHLEALRAAGFEVLYLTDPVDEWVLQRLTEFDGKPIRQVEKGELETGDEEAKKKREAKQAEYKDLLEALAGALADDVSEVRFTGRLENSPAVLVSERDALSVHLERALRSSGRELPRRKRILELNPEHRLVGGLKKVFDVDPKSPRIAEYAQLLHGQALLAEGSPLPDPARFSKLVTELMVAAVEG